MQITLKPKNVVFFKCVPMSLIILTQQRPLCVMYLYDYILGLNTRSVANLKNSNLLIKFCFVCNNCATRTEAQRGGGCSFSVVSYYRLGYVGNRVDSEG